MILNLSNISIITTVIIYLVIAFIQLRRSFLMNSRVNYLREKGVRSPAKVLSYARPNFVEVEFINHEKSKVRKDFRLLKNVDKLPVGSDVTVLMGDNPNNNPALVLEYNGKPMVSKISKYTLFGLTLCLIAVLLLLGLYKITVDNITGNYTGFLVPIVAAIVIFVVVTEDEMAKSRVHNWLLLYGLNATAHIRRSSFTGVVKQVDRQISFFLDFVDAIGNARFAKSEDSLRPEDYQVLKDEKKVERLEVPNIQKNYCLLNLIWK